MSFPIGSQHQSDADLIPTYTVCIVGDPRSGKSCFCNRFVYSHPDWYQEGHPSMLRESDFHGPVVNSNHWLYWGTVTRRLDDETTIRFCVIEQTEFLSDTTSLPFNPSVVSTYSSSIANTPSAASVPSSASVTSASSLHSSSRLHDYILRSTSMKVFSPGKLRYYCIDQLGHEDRYKQELFPHNGPLEVHGFLVVYDVSRRACHDVPDLQQQQLTFLVDILTLISKRKKPVVVVASKRDTVDEQCLSSVTQFLQKSPDFRKIPIVEASAHRNINVELAFLTLARLLENSSNKSRISKLRLQSYQEATREQDEHQRRLREAFVNRVSLSPASFLTDWPTFLSRYSHQSDVARFIDLWGSEVAKETFEQFTAQWKTETKRRHMARLPEALSTLLLYVGPVTNQSPKELLKRLRSHSQFDHFFISVDSLDDNSLNRHSFHGDDTRIPFSLALKEPPDNGDSPFMEAIKSLLIAEAWASNMSTFEDALLQWQDSSKILAGQQFDLDQLPHVDRTPVLCHDDQIEVYQKFQECLRLYTREEFLDLLLENLPLFIRAASDYLNCLGDFFFASSFTPTRTQPPHQPRSEPNRSRPISPSEASNVPLGSVQLPPADIRLCAVLAPPRGAKEQQLNIIRSCISSDYRYRAMDFMPSERQTYLTSHLDILLHRSEFQNEALASPPSTIQRHYSCSFTGQQETSMQPTFPLPQCPAYQSGLCMDLVFENLFSNVGWSVGETPNTFSSRLSSVLGQGDKCLRVAVCSICTDVVAATAGSHLFRAAGFVPEGVTSPSLLTTPSSVSRMAQNLSSSWPLASTLLTPVDTSIASVNGDSFISPVLGTIQASFLSHHGASLLTLVTNPRQSSDVFDGVVFLLSTDENQPFLLPCICGKSCYCCRCCRGALDCSHTTPRPRSLYSRATAIKALVEHLGRMPHLIILAGGKESCIAMGSSKTMMLTSLTESSPKTPIPESSLHFSELQSRSFSFENSDEKGNNSTLTSTKPQPPFVLDALSDFLSSCWARKLASTDGGSGGGGGRRRKISSSQRQNASPKARGNVDGSCSTIQEECLRSAPSPARRSHRHRCCHRHHCYQHRYHHHHHIHRHHYHIHHCQQRLHRCSPVNTAVIGSGIFTTSRASSNSSTGGLNPQLPKLTLTPAEVTPAFLRRQNFVRSYSFPMLSVKQTPYHDLVSSGLARQKSRSLCCRKNTNNQPFESGASKQDALSVFRLDNFANEDKSPNRLMMTRRYRQELLSTSILDPPTGDCSSIASSCSPCPGAIASYPSLLATSALSSPILSTPSDPSSILLQFAEGTSPKLPDDVDPSTPLHVMPSFHEMSPLRRRWRPVKITTKGLAPTSSTTTASLDANGVEEPRAASRLKEEETFHTVEDALQFGMVRLVPCPHLMKAVVDPEKSPMYGRGHGQLDKVHYASRKTFDLGPVSKLSHHPSQLSSNSHTHLHNQSTMGTTVTAGSGGGSVSSFLSSGLRAVTSGFVRPRERRRSVSTPCGNEAPGNANNEGGCGNTVTNIPSSSTPGSARASDFAHSICALPGSGTSHLTAAGYSTDTASKASTPPYVTDEVDGLCAANDGSGLNPESPLPCLQVSSVSEMMEIANISNRRTYPYTPNQEKNCNNSAETVTPSVSGCQPRHWHLPTCPHRLCIPRQNLPPPPSLIRRHANNNFSSTGSHVSIINSSTQLEDHLSFRNSYYQHHNQSESVAAQPPELRHLPVEHPRLHRQQPTTIAPVSLSAFQGDRRSALDLPSYLETTSAAGVVCSTAAATPDNRSTTCLLASSASQRLSPPPTPTSATTSKSLFNTTTTVRKNKRTMLSLFGGRTTTSLSSNHHHHQSNQQVNSHNPANSVGTFATSSGSGGASFPSTPVHESPTSSSIVMATTSVQVNSATPPLAANFTSFSSNSSSGGSSSVPAANNSNG